jgi:hypothetical protein
MKKGLGREATCILGRHNFLILRRFDAQEGWIAGSEEVCPTDADLMTGA